MVGHLSKKQITKLKEAFLVFGHGAFGSARTKETESIMMSLGYKPTETVSYKTLLIK
jgi:Ca2+-binding EF-hand superfamily protein